MYKVSKTIKIVLILGSFASYAYGQHNQQRSAYTIRQTSPVSCGPAALASFLTYFIDLNVTEQDVFKAAQPFATYEGEGEKQKISFNAFSLKKASAAWGISMKGYKISPDLVSEYFEKKGLPVIAHLEKPQPHFVLLIGYTNRYLVISDPSWGRRLELAKEYLQQKNFSGNILVPSVDESQKIKIQAAQLDNLRWASNQLRRLGIK